MVQERVVEGMLVTVPFKEQGEDRPFERGFPRKPYHGDKRGEEAVIATDGLFVNGDAGFDSEGFRLASARGT